MRRLTDHALRCTLTEGLDLQLQLACAAPCARDGTGPDLEVVACAALLHAVTATRAVTIGAAKDLAKGLAALGACTIAPADVLKVLGTAERRDAAVQLEKLLACALASHVHATDGDVDEDGEALLAPFTPVGSMDANAEHFHFFF